jgi:hypothetical protein
MREPRMSEKRDDDRDSADRPAPLADLAREVGERRDERERRSRRERQGQSNAADSEDPFEEVDVGDVDRERLWRDLLDDDREGDSTAGEDVGVSESGEVAESTGVGDDRATSSDESQRGATDARGDVVTKRSYCEQCPHFSAPPEAVCGHEGTEIVEMVSIDRFRVRNCPMVDD